LLAVGSAGANGGADQYDEGRVSQR
jgi:hypothetical protein